MRYGMRLGRGTWVTGGGGVLFASTFAGLLYLTMLVWASAVAAALGLLFFLVAYALRNTKSARRAQLAMPLRDSLDETALGALNGRTKVWAVYTVGDQFHHGIYPKKGEDLLRLYPDRAAQIARVVLFPDASRARSAAGRLQRQGYSFAELLSLFPNNFTPGHGLDQRAQPVPFPEAQRASRVERADVFSAERAVSRRSDTPQTRPLEARPARSTEPTIVNLEEHPMSAQRDTTQYMFNGETMGKARLVLALVRRYVRENPGAAFQDVRSAFPDELQADSPILFTKQRCVVARIDDLSSAGRKRFHVSDGESIELSDGVIVVSREWNRFNIHNILRRAQELGYAVEAGTGAR
jgi:hypothetical protein